MSIIIGADIVPTSNNLHLFETGNVDELLGEELKHIIYNADYRIFNLETPITDKENPILKCGNNHITPTSAVNGLKAMRIDLLSISNNHILDQGTEGLLDTIKVLNNENINTCGADKNLEQAALPFYFSFNKKRICIYSCAEHEFSIASYDKPGANPFDPLESLDHIVEAKRNADYLIVLYHGGKEHFKYPTPQLQKICRKIVQKGADLVICQHSHCIGCMEQYDKGTIVYGQGNFIFEEEENDLWKTSLLTVINNDCSISFIPVIHKNGCIRIPKEEQAKDILDGFYKRSEELLDSAFISNTFTTVVEQMNTVYYQALYGKESLLFKIINKLFFGKLRTFIYDKKYQRHELVKLKNYIECETHREFLLKMIENRIISKN